MGSMDTAVTAIGADRIVQNLGLTGQGVTVALLDSGIAPNAAIANNRVLARADFTGQGATGDGFGHGTHIAATIGGSGANGAVRGIAPGVVVRLGARAAGGRLRLRERRDPGPSTG